MIVVPVTLREANDFVEQFHRHNGRTARNGGKFAIGASENGELVGVAIVGNPISATFMDGFTAEVLRTCVRPEAPRNANSFLYGACWRVWRAMGGLRLVTYTLQSESGASLRGAGWKMVGEVRPTEDGWRKNDHLARTWQPVMGQLKFRWEKAEEITESRPPKRIAFTFDERSLVTEGEAMEMAGFAGLKLPQIPLCTCGYGGGPSAAHKGDCPMRTWE